MSTINPIPIIKERWPFTTKASLVGLAVSGSVIIIIWYCRKRRTKMAPKPQSQLTSSQLPLNGKAISAGGDVDTIDRSSVCNSSIKRKRDRTTNRTTSISSRASTLQGSYFSTATDNFLSVNNDDLDLTDCGRLGLQALLTVIQQLEHAMDRFQKFEVNLIAADPENESMHLMRELGVLLEQAISLRESCKQKMILEDEEFYLSDEGSDSDSASFVSATEFIDISDLNDLKIIPTENLLYKAALLELENGNVKYRSVRTQMVCCESDAEYLAKLHCLRQAFDLILEDSTRRNVLKNGGRDVLSNLLESLGYNPTDFQRSYDDMMTFLERCDDYGSIQEEILAKGHKVVNFFDIVFDAFLLDALQDLSNPPSSLLAVIQNRWLTNGFKKTALSSTIYTLVLAKKKLLKYPDGFYSRFYSIIAAIAPALAWGFLGPEEALNKTCDKFKDLLYAFVIDIFSFKKVRYTGSEELADSIFHSYQILTGNLLSMVDKATNL